MADTIQSLKVEIRVTGLVIGDNGTQQKIDDAYSFSFEDGTGNAQVQTLYKAQRSLNNTNEDLDLVGSSIKDFQGQNLAFAKLKMLLLKNNSTTSGDDMTLSQSASNGVPIGVAAGDGLHTGSEGLILIINPNEGFTVTGSTGDLVNVALDHNGSYKILAAG